MNRHRPTLFVPCPRPMTYRQYLLRHGDDRVAPEETVAKYEAYKKDFEEKTLRSFFESHCDTEWFQRKYHPLQRRVADNERREHARVASARFFEKYGRNEDALRALAAKRQYDLLSERKKKEAEGPTKDDEKKDAVVFLFLRHVPEMVSRDELVDWIRSKLTQDDLESADAVSKADALVSRVLLSDATASPPAGYDRFAYVECANASCAKIVKSRLANTTLKVQRGTTTISKRIYVSENHTTTRPKEVLPLASSAHERLLVDLKQARELARALDRERGLDNATDASSLDAFWESSNLIASEIDAGRGNGELTRTMLDVTMEWLRTVHCHSYYAGITFASEGDLLHPRSARIVRDSSSETDDALRAVVVSVDTYTSSSSSSSSSSSVTNASPAPVPDAADSEKSETKILKTGAWEPKIDARFRDAMMQVRVRETAEAKWLEDETKASALQADAERDALANGIEKISSDRYRCTFAPPCSKLFESEATLLRHIRSKHADVLRVKKNLGGVKEMMYERFARDDRKPPMVVIAKEPPSQFFPGIPPPPLGTRPPPMMMMNMPPMFRPPFVAQPRLADHSQTPSPRPRFENGAIRRLADGKILYLDPDASQDEITSPSSSSQKKKVAPAPGSETKEAPSEGRALINYDDF